MNLSSFFNILRQIFKGIFRYTIFNWRGFLKIPIWAKLLSLFITGFVFVCLLILAIANNFLGIFGKMPDINVHENKVAVASEMYSADGVLIAKYFTENRTPVKYNEISPAVINCLIATEDVRFYEHSGIDVYSLFSAMWANLQGEKRGASTITQQLVKNIYKTRQTTDGLVAYIPFLHTINQKMKEWIVAVRLEWRYSKEEILTMYLNTVDFGSNAFGVRTAARTFFDVLPSKLTIPESATLIGQLKATSFYNPIKNPNNALERRNIVISQLRKYDYITEKEYKKFIETPIRLRFPKRQTFDTVAQYFRESAAKFLEKWCKKNNYNLYTDGLKIYTSLDTRIQKHAEKATSIQMQRLQERFRQHWQNYYQTPWEAFRKPNDLPEDFVLNKLEEVKIYKPLFKKYRKIRVLDSLRKEKPMRIFTWEGIKDVQMSPIDSVKYYMQILQAGLMTIEPQTGFVKAWVGGIDFDNFSFDHVIQSKRQPGSTFKPFVYAEAFEQGFAPCDRMLDAPLTINYEENGEKKSWSPQNANYEYTYTPITLRKAMGTSKNSVTARLTEQITPEAVRKRAILMGITSPLNSVPSIGLGSNVLSLYELVGAYGAFMNEGEWIEPVFVSQIKDRNGKVIYDAKPNKRRVMTEETAFLMTDMLRAGVWEQDGTSQALFEFPELFKENNEIGGKTGTSSNYADGWYLGVTKDLITGVWVGADDHRIRFRTPEAGEASQTALPLYGIYMEMLYQDSTLNIKRGKFPEPKIEIKKQYGCLSPYIFKRKKVVESQEVKLE